MNPEKQRIEIAKACGWTDFQEPLNCGVIWAVRPDTGYGAMVPSYPTDLNAIHDAIMSVIVRGSDLIEFRSNEDLLEEQLDALCAREQVPCWHFSAELYAEAFLKTLGKWEDA